MCGHWLVDAISKKECDPKLNNFFRENNRINVFKYSNYDKNE